MPNKIYQRDETAITWLNTGGTNLLTLTSVATAAGRQGAHHDLTTSARSPRFVYRAWVVPVSAPTVGTIVQLYLKTSDGTHPDNDDGTGDIVVSSIDKLRNLIPLKPIVCDEAAIVEYVSSGIIEIGARYCAPVFWNTLGVALSATATLHGFSLTPIPLEVQ